MSSVTVVCFDALIKKIYTSRSEQPTKSFAPPPDLSRLSDCDSQSRFTLCPNYTRVAILGAAVDSSITDLQSTLITDCQDSTLHTVHATIYICDARCLIVLFSSYPMAEI
ncbi:hypothetical protein J6590_040244 [Homalodisca vitripennis]|nr:hypothetical protein J6590_040244 [Homalodisca vitripennis]